MADLAMGSDANEMIRAANQQALLIMLDLAAGDLAEAGLVAWIAAHSRVRRPRARRLSRALRPFRVRGSSPCCKRHFKWAGAERLGPFGPC